MQPLEHLLDDIAGIGGGWLLLLAFALALGETAFLTDLVVPGEAGLVLVGAAAARAGVPLPAVIVFAAVGATVGDSVGWLIGRYAGLRLLERWRWSRRVVVPKLTSARVYFEGRGGAAVFLGKFVGAMRAIVSVVAGLNRMPYTRFLAWNALGSIVWTGLVISVGYFFGEHADNAVADVGLLVALAIVALALAYLPLRRRRKN